MTTKLAAIVIPCLNEQQSLMPTCNSLGFGTGRQSPSNTLLIIVDNGSEDGTIAIAKQIQQQSSAASVMITTEPERGYVPPRRTGNRLAISTATERGVAIDNLVIIQADADTSYSEGYADAISSHARQLGPGVLIDSLSEHQESFIEQQEEYLTLCDEIDQEFESVLSDQARDVIVDDKACAYWASDYDMWGGHQREYTSWGDEIHSETARLYIRARSFGARRSLCEEAVAKHSDRRTLEDPAYAFATAGFPRESAFKRRWDRLYDGPKEITSFSEMANRSKILMAVGCRRAHIQGLFQLLTGHLERALGSCQSEHSIPGEIILPARDVQSVRERPGVLIEDILMQVDSRAFDLA